MTRRRSGWGQATLIVALTMALGAVTYFAPATTAQSADLVLDFTGTVTSGPSAGTRLSGPLSLDLGDDGSLSGSLQTADAAIPVAGQLADGTINVTFDLGAAQVNGTGSQIAGQPVFIGTFDGPADGDAGIWSAG